MTTIRRPTGSGRPRTKKKPNKPEELSQKALIDWSLWERIPPAPDIEQGERGARVFDYLFAIPNGGSRNKIEAGNLKACGVKAGVWDLMLPIARSGFHGLWIEMKAGKNNLTDKQDEWERRMVIAGYKTTVCWSTQEAIDAIRQYLGIKR